MKVNVETIKLNFNNVDLFLNLGDGIVVTDIRESRVSEIEVSTNSNEKEPYFGIFVTNKCNFRCGYCFNKKCHISLDPVFTPKDFTSFLKNNGYKKIQIRFLGGEPLLNKEWMYECVELLRENKIECKYDIFTNSTLIDSEFMEFAKNHDFQFFVSVAGKNEPEKGVKHKKKIGEKINLINQNNMTVLSRALYNPKQISLLELIGDIFEHNIKFLSIGFEWGKGEENPKEFMAKIKLDLREFAEFYIENILQENLKYLAINPFIGYIKNWLLNEEYHMDACEAGKGLFSLSTTGDFYSCYALNQVEAFKCGNIFESVEPNLSNINADTITACKSCDIKYLCKSRCFADSYLVNNDYLKVVELKCQLEKEIIACSAYILYTLSKYEKQFKLFRYAIKKGMINYDIAH